MFLKLTLEHNSTPCLVNMDNVTTINRYKSPEGAEMTIISFLDPDDTITVKEPLHQLTALTDTGNA